MRAYEIRRLRPDDWPAFREIRLEALQDTPIGFGEWHRDAVRLTAEEWRQRVERVAEPSQTALFAALDESERFVGLAGVYPRAGQTEGVREMVVYSVYVTPEHRGAKNGVAPQLFDAAIAWARDVGKADLITLSVHEDNDRAHRFYERYGFVDTGETTPYVLDET
ncbi:MAG: GNAT family N-acetyltransferase, partial [Actinocrinis sp.]